MGGFSAGEGGRGSGKARAELSASHACCPQSGELELWESGFEWKKQERVRVRRLLCSLVRRNGGKQMLKEGIHKL